MSLIGPIIQSIRVDKKSVSSGSMVFLNAKIDETVPLFGPAFVFDVGSNHLLDNVSKDSLAVIVEVELYSEAEENWSLKFEKDSFYVPLTLSHVITTGDMAMIRFNATSVKTESFYHVNPRVVMQAPLQWVQEHKELDRYITPDAKFMLRVGFVREVIDPLP
jgi:hypothetical protein